MKIVDVYSERGEEIEGIDDIVVDAAEWSNINFDDDDEPSENENPENASEESNDLVTAENANNAQVDGFHEEPLNIIDEMDCVSVNGLEVMMDDEVEEIESDKDDDAEENGFEPDQLVWAKLRYCPYWPARVIQRPPELLTIAPSKVSVLFFGSRCVGLVSRRNIVDYSANRTKYATRSFNTCFPYAVRQMDEFIEDPAGHSTNSCIEDANSILTVKQEFEPFIKVEKDLDDYPCQFECVRRSDPASLLAQTETRRLKLERKNREFQQIIIEKSQTISELTDDNAKIVNENSRLKAKLYELEKENRELMAGHKNVLRSMGLDSDDQLPSTSRGKRKPGPKSATVNRGRTKKRPMRIVEEEDDDEDDSDFSGRPIKQEVLDENEQAALKFKENEVIEIEDNPVCILATGEKQYEVEKILAHRRWKNQLWFKIRWKGYTAKDDDWIAKANLDCPELLEEYMSAKNVSTRPNPKRRRKNKRN